MMGMTREAYDKKIASVSRQAHKNFKRLTKFVSKLGLNDKQFDALCSIIDSYTNLNVESVAYCHKHGIDPSDFMTDVMSRSMVENGN